MKNFLRLLRYGLPVYAAVDTGRIAAGRGGRAGQFSRAAAFSPSSTGCWRPNAPEGPILLGLPKSKWHFDLRAIIPHFLHMHNAWDVVAFALVVSTVLKGFAITWAPTW